MRLLAKSNKPLPARRVARVHISIESDRSDEVTNATSVHRSEEEEVMEWDSYFISGGHPGLGMVKGYHDELGWEDSSSEQSGCDDIHGRKRFRLGSLFRQ